MVALVGSYPDAALGALHVDLRVVGDGLDAAHAVDVRDHSPNRQIAVHPHEGVRCAEQHRHLLLPRVRRRALPSVEPLRGLGVRVQ